MKVSQIEKKFWEFHRKNPHVYGLFNRFSMDLIDAGYNALSASRVIERIRWEAMIETDRVDQYKVSNNHKPHYARMWNRKNPNSRAQFITKTLQDGTP